MGKFVFRLATQGDRDIIYRLRHDVYAAELAQHRQNLEGMLRASFHGQYLISLGFVQDLIYCAKDRVDVVPVLDGNKIKKFKSP